MNMPVPMQLALRIGQVGLDVAGQNAVKAQILAGAQAHAAGLQAQANSAKAASTGGFTLVPNNPTTGVQVDSASVQVAQAPNGAGGSGTNRNEW